LWRVLWHCYFDPAEPSQLMIAEMVGISDSSVSDYRRKLEAELRGLNLLAAQVRHFTEELEEQLRWRLFVLEPPPEEMPRELDLVDITANWSPLPYRSLLLANAAHVV
jgi:hypothetical protein